ncbi:MAG: TonB-dependent receptor [Muribaculaceae bacterium]|nr:TonB-dependent receptor [Muribaculaceae bacterium]
MKKSIFSLLVLLMATLTMRAEDILVEGTVVSAEDGEPLIGATILSLETKKGTATDIDGNFQLQVPANSKIKVSYIGYKDFEGVVAPHMEITLHENSEVLDEVVVVGYSTQRKADLTGSVSVVNTKDFETASTTDPMQALQGKVPGMTITPNNGGSPVSAGTVRIRGIGSFNADQSPLFVIDGVPTTTNLNTLNMNDIESMQVLKDAASASIYGSRAANGVIIITTKQGKKGGDSKIKVDFSASWTAQFYTKSQKMSLLDTPGYATAMAQAALNDGMDPVAYAANYGLNLNATAGIPISVYNPLTGQYVGYTVNGLYDGYINSRKTMRCSNTDWLDEITRTGFLQNYDLSLSRASENSRSLFSVGYKKNAGIIKDTDFQSLAVRMNNAYDIFKWLTVGENATVTYSNQVDCAPMENALKMSPTVPVYEEDGVTFGGPVGGMSDRQNPMREIAFNKDNRLKIWRIFGNGYIDIKPFKGFTFRSNFGLDYEAGFIHSYNYTFHSDIVNNDTNSTTLSQSNDTKWTWTNTINYDFNIKEQNEFHVLAGIEFFRQTYVGFSGVNQGFDIETPEYMWPDASTGLEYSTGNESKYSLLSFFGKIDYSWRNLILASFTIRRDGSSRFGRNYKYGTFPAATLGYRLSENIEKPWLNDLKLRASWGKTGNQAIANNAYQALYVADYGADRVTSTAYDIFLQQSGIFPSGYRAIQSENPNLKWESTIQWNFGVDYGFLNNRLTGSIDAYIKDVKDMLINPAYLAAMGEGGAAWANGPSLRNWGMEFLVGWKDYVESCGLSYSIQWNGDFFRNRVTYLPSSTTGSYVHTTSQNLVEARKPYGSIVGYVVDGLFQNKEEVLASGQDNARVGGLKYVDLNGDGRINADDQTWIFNPVPDFSMGLNVNLSWNNFDFQMFWQGVFGQDVYNNQKFQTDFWSITDAGSNKGDRMLNAWTQANSSSTIPALTTNNTADEGRASTYYVENGSYAKLRTLQLGYNLPEKILKNTAISNVRFYVSGNNICTIKSKSLTCSDPENPNWAYPLSTSVSFGVQLGF